MLLHVTPKLENFNLV